MNVFNPALEQKIAASGNIAVVVIDDAKNAVSLARALLAGGVDVMELTLRTPAALDAIRAVVGEVEGMQVGAGTVLTPTQLRQAADAGAAFAVAPGFNPRVVAAARDIGLSFAPGVMTPSEIEGALELGCRLLKYFPAGVVGGLAGLKSLAAPYAHLGIRFIPLGGLTPETTGDYFASPLVAACGGSWIAPARQIAAADWDGIRDNAARATAIMKTARAQRKNQP
ncbi:MAG: bifunctional 4-hydroxy-2-oxoglutarate aldolase/2-dehydro-3-deoxy-phosphogluconate aldolase [Kiritimatiellia bacterium]|jgi:2-dehydro-3-deoxyphosphogluconate aldolase/(4S)-4-hydroxy-2-oxoglutarate aldolase